MHEYIQLLLLLLFSFKTTHYEKSVYIKSKTLKDCYHFLCTLLQKRPANFFSFSDHKERISSFAEVVLQR